MSEEINSETLFREKNLKKAAAPEQLDDYLKVTSFSSWFVIIAAALALAALLVWVFCGHIDDTVKGAGVCEGGVLICYFPAEELEGVSPGGTLRAGESELEITAVDPERCADYELPVELLPLLPEQRWFVSVSAETELPDGLYGAELVNPIKPSSFLTKGA